MDQIIQSRYKNTGNICSASQQWKVMRIMTKAEFGKIAAIVTRCTLHFGGASSILISLKATTKMTKDEQQKIFNSNAFSKARYIHTHSFVPPFLWGQTIVSHPFVVELLMFTLVVVIISPDYRKQTNHGATQHNTNINLFSVKWHKRSRNTDVSSKIVISSTKKKNYFSRISEATIYQCHGR